MEEYLQIGEISKLFNISTHAIRFYEKKGLINPCKIGESNYRFYDFKNISELEYILLLRKCGFSVEKTKEILQTKNITNYISSLNSASNDIDEEIEKLTKQKYLIHTLKNLVEYYKQNINKIIEKKFETRYLVEIISIKNKELNKLTERVIYEHFCKYANFNKINSTRDIIHLSSYKETKICILVDKKDFINVQNTKKHILEEGTYISYLHHIKSEKDYILALKFIGKYLKNNNYKEPDYIIDIETFDYNIFTKENIECIESQLYIINDL